LTVPGNATFDLQRAVRRACIFIMSICSLRLLDYWTLFIYFL
jgi:hypothetical protein